MIRLRREPGLTNREARALEARAAEEMRSIGNYVAWLITRDLDRKPRRPICASRMWIALLAGFFRRASEEEAHRRYLTGEEEVLAAGANRQDVEEHVAPNRDVFADCVLDAEARVHQEPYLVVVPPAVLVDEREPQTRLEEGPQLAEVFVGARNVEGTA